MKIVGVIRVAPREGADTIVAKEFVRIKHPRQKSPQLLGSDGREHPVAKVAHFIDVREIATDLRIAPREPA
jgi:hypothetical protein